MCNDLLNSRKRKEYHNRKSKKCLNCDVITSNKFCSVKCKHIYNRLEIFTLIENSIAVFPTSVTSNRWFKKYLIHKYGEQCMDCRWNEKNKYTGNVPIELEHIDGNHENYTLSNLKLLCPNCHSLISTYKGANRGNGRYNRREKYAKGKSF
jgi:hypothetical protein